MIYTVFAVTVVIHKFVRDKYSKRFPELESLVHTPLEYIKTVQVCKYINYILACLSGAQWCLPWFIAIKKRPWSDTSWSEWDTPSSDHYGCISHSFDYTRVSCIIVIMFCSTDCVSLMKPEDWERWARPGVGSLWYGEIELVADCLAGSIILLLHFILGPRTEREEVENNGICWVKNVLHCS